ncbi:Protein kinase domain-containing protein [Balamuthia mandrillaris]
MMEQLQQHIHNKIEHNNMAEVDYVWRKGHDQLLKMYGRRGTTTTRTDAAPQKKVDVIWYCLSAKSFSALPSSSSSIGEQEAEIEGGEVDGAMDREKEKREDSEEEDAALDHDDDDENKKMKRDLEERVEFLQELSKEVPVIVVHTILSPFIEDSTVLTTNRSNNSIAHAKEWLFELRESCPALKEVLSVDLGAAEEWRTAQQLEALAKATVQSFSHHRKVMLKKNPETWYEGDTIRGYIYGMGKELTKRDDLYIGEWVDGEKHGVGTQRYWNKDKYEGGWAKGKRHGEGRYVWENGDVFDGHWENDKREGTGSMVWKSKKKGKLEALWQDDLPGGVGIYTSEEGDKYIGTFDVIPISSYSPVSSFHIQKHGQGELHCSDGSRYLGTFNKDQRNGYGVFLFPNGDKYYGSWKDNKRHGRGLLLFSDGTFYDGGWWNDLKEGEGKLQFANGDSLIGYWKGDNLTKASFKKGDPSMSSRGAQRLMNTTLSDSIHALSGTPMMDANKWSGIGGSLSAVKLSLQDLPTYLSSSSNPVGERVYHFSITFHSMYSLSSSNTTKVDRLLPNAIDDIISFITFTHQELVNGVNWEVEPLPSADPAANNAHLNKLVLIHLKDIVFQKVYSTLFTLYQDKNKLRDGSFHAKMLSLKDVTLEDLGVNTSADHSNMDETRLLTGLNAAVQRLKNLEKEKTVRGKLACLVATSKEIIKACNASSSTTTSAATSSDDDDEAELNRKRTRAMDSLDIDRNSDEEETQPNIGAEEKFPMFVWVVLKANIGDLCCHHDFLTDFMPKQTLTKSEIGYRVAELKAAIEYCFQLDTNICNEKGTLIPYITLESSVKNALNTATKRFVQSLNDESKQNNSNDTSSTDFHHSSSPSTITAYSSASFLSSLPFRSPFNNTTSSSSSSSSSSTVPLRIGFLVDILREISQRQRKRYESYPLLQEDVLVLEVHKQIMDDLLASMGLKLISYSVSEEREGDDKGKKEEENVKSKKTTTAAMGLGFEVKYPMWVYANFANIVAQFVHANT